jgi:hypothetical protein
MRTSTEYLPRNLEKVPPFLQMALWPSGRLLSKGRATGASSRRSVVRSRIHVLQREIHIWRLNAA